MYSLILVFVLRNYGAKENGFQNPQNQPKKEPGQAAQTKTNNMVGVRMSCTLNVWTRVGLYKERHQRNSIKKFKNTT